MLAGGAGRRVIIDFDSTFIQAESLDELARLALAGAPDRRARTANIEWITREGMAGRMGFGEALERQLNQFEPSRAHVSELIASLETRISPSIRDHRWLLREHAADIWIMSGGFGDIIRPLVEPFGIAADHVLANEFIWDAADLAHGCDQANPLAHDDGKVTAVRNLGFDPAHIMMVGDDATDLAVREAGAAGTFIAYVETINRPAVSLRADIIARDFGTVAKVAGWQ